MNYIEPDEFLKLSGHIPAIDVRSPGEFEHGHIPGACNIPLFNNEERAIVGTIYNREGRAAAMEKGLEIANPKKSKLIDQATRIARDKKLLVHCWRGGMRSEKMAVLFETAGLTCSVMKGGYKFYRQMLFEDFKNARNLLVLHGPTGSGKTEILNKLHDAGEQVIDLEHYAHHRGSVFGNIGLEPQPTTMQFQNDIHDCLRKLDPGRRIWVEGESLNIGKVYLPATLWEQMNISTTVRIDMPLSQRVQRIVAEYGNFPTDVLIGSIQKLTKRFGGDRTAQVMQLVENRRMEEAVALLLDYYDQNYNFSVVKYIKGKILTVNTNSPDASVNAKRVLKILNESELHA